MSTSPGFQPPARLVQKSKFTPLPDNGAHYAVLSQWLAAITAGNSEDGIAKRAREIQDERKDRSAYEHRAAVEGGFRPLKVRVTQTYTQEQILSYNPFIETGFQAKAFPKTVFNGFDIVEPWKIGEFSLVPLYELGGGSFGRVICALASSSKYPDPFEVAIKITPAKWRKYFYREYATMSRFRKTDIMPRLVVGGDCSEYSYLVMMKYHTTLAARIDVMGVLGEEEGVPVEELRPIVKEILVLLSKLHRSHTAHLDIKPWNILVATSGRLALCDVASALRWKSQDDSTIVLPKQGTPGFLAPEVRDGEPVRDHRRADMYSLGVTIAFLRAVMVPDKTITQEAISSGVELAFSTGAYPLANDFLQKLLQVRNDQRLSAEEALSHPWFEGCSIKPRNTTWMRYIASSRVRANVMHPGPIELYSGPKAAS